MFTGIVQKKAQIVELERLQGLTRYAVSLPHDLTEELKTGASIAIDGVCQTVIKIEGPLVWFEAIPETLKKTTLKSLRLGQWVNVERSVRMGEEIGGRLLSGHVHEIGIIGRFDKFSHHAVLMVKLLDASSIKYLFPKGYIAIDGASLTVVDVFPEDQSFTVHLIPETLQRTTLTEKKENQEVNIELDHQTQVIVDTLERIKAAT